MPLVVIAVFFVLIGFLRAPQQQRMRAHRCFIAALKPGDEVVTTAGIFGTVVDLDDADRAGRDRRRGRHRRSHAARRSSTSRTSSPRTPAADDADHGARRSPTTSTVQIATRAGRRPCRPSRSRDADRAAGRAQPTTGPAIDRPTVPPPSRRPPPTRPESTPRRSRHRLPPPPRAGSATRDARLGRADSPLTPGASDSAG